MNVPHGIARSDDHGRSWSVRTSEDLPSATATLDRPCLIVSPDDDLTVLVAVANTRTIYETHDAGLHWAAHVLTFGATGFTLITKLAFLHKNVAIVASDSGWVARSEDGGATWSPSAQISSPAVLWWLDASIDHPSTVFARTEVPDAPFYRSDDSGRTWMAGPPVGLVGDIVDDGLGGFLVAAAYGIVRFQ